MIVIFSTLKNVQKKGWKIMTEKQLDNMLKNYTKTANQRLYNIRRQGLDKASNAYRYVETLAYDDKGVYETYSGNLKFNLELKNMTLKEKKEQLKVVDKFLQSKTSTVGGTNRKYKKAFESFNEERRKQEKKTFTFDEYVDLWDDYYLQKYYKTFGSLETINLVNANGHAKAVDIARELFLYAENNNIDEGDLTLEEVNKIKERH